MSEIEKMMQNANIEKHWNSTPYGGVEEHYPPFTAEKQLELIKWLAKTGDVCRIDATVKNKWFVENEVGYSKCFAEFEEALANVINIIWEYLPEEDKQQVKGILE
jgi:hypothetical protein